MDSFVIISLLQLLLFVFHRSRPRRTFDKFVINKSRHCSVPKAKALAVFLFKCMADESFLSNHIIRNRNLEQWVRARTITARWRSWARCTVRVPRPWWWWGGGLTWWAAAASSSWTASRGWCSGQMAVPPLAPAASSSSGTGVAIPSSSSVDRYTNIHVLTYTNVWNTVVGTLDRTSSRCSYCSFGSIDYVRTLIGTWESIVVVIMLQAGGVLQALSIHKKWKGYTLDYEGSQKLVFSLKEPTSNGSMCLPRNSSRIRICLEPRRSGGDSCFQVDGYFPDRDCSIVNSTGLAIAKVTSIYWTKHIRN